MDRLMDGQNDPITDGPSKKKKMNTTEKESGH